MRNDEVIQEQPDQAALTERYVDECLQFIREHKDEPFFLYFAQMYVHLPIYAPSPYVKKSQNGRYGAAVEHLDWTLGVLLAELKRLSLDENTLVIFTSDNGSRASKDGEGAGAGSNAPLRGTKGTCWEGGQRVPMIARWPGKIPSGTTCAAMASAMDFLPTFIGLAGSDLQPDTEKQIDGKDILPLMTGQSEKSPYDAFFYYSVGNLHAVRSGNWKLHLCRKEGREHKRIPLELYDLERDINEQENLADRQPEVVETLLGRAQGARDSLGDRIQGIEGSERRPKGRYAEHQPLTRFDPAYPYFAAEYDLADGG
jgi:arylsulfatase A-like enzyme